MLKIVSAILILSQLSCREQAPEKKSHVEANQAYVPQEPDIRTYPFRIGNTTITTKTYRFADKSSPVFIIVHDDETTASEAVRQVLEEEGGYLVEIENGQERLISFRSGARSYKFDPNRMFTNTGLRGNLRSLNGSYSKSAFNEVKKFSSFILQKIPRNAGTIIAVHNNDENGFSAKSYVSGGPYSGDAKDVFLNSAEDADNFFLTTDAGIHQKLKKEKFNTVFQENRRAKDDGSLSVYYGRRNKSYVNVETQIGQKEKQVQMINALLDLLSQAK